MSKIYERESTSRKDSSTQNLSFHEATSTMFFFSQFFGVFPIENIRNRDENKLRFSWISPRTLYALTFLLFGTAETILAVRRLLRFGFNMGFAEALFFFTLSMTRAFLIFRINLKWKKIIKYWRKCENSFLSYPYAETGWSLKKKCRLIFIYFLVQLFVPHIFFMASSIYDNHIQITTCPVPYDSFWKNYLAHYRPHLLANIPYSPYLLPFYEWVNLLQAHAESFSDSFIMLLATGLSTRFSQFNDLLRKIILKDRDLMNAGMWRKMRMDYVHLIDLLRFVDTHINVLTFVCIGHNAFLMAFKVFNIFRQTRFNTISHVSFWFFLITLATRLAGVLITCSTIHKNATKSLEFLRNIPGRNWSLDLKILYDIIEFEEPSLAFSIIRASFITRNMILSLFGTMATFQIILFDQVHDSEETVCSDAVV